MQHMFWIQRGNRRQVAGNEYSNLSHRPLSARPVAFHQRSVAISGTTLSTLLPAYGTIIIRGEAV